MVNLLTLVMCTLIGMLCFRCAKKRGRNPHAWFAIGLFFGIFGLGALFLLPPLNKLPRIGPSPDPLLAKKNLEILDPSHSSKLWYYLDEENQQFGPMSLDALTNAWERGKVDKTTYVWNEVMENWKHLEEVLRTPLQNASLKRLS
jgi:hypothetical protein